MKYYYIFYYNHRLNCPNFPIYEIKLEHPPTQEEILENKPSNAIGYSVKCRYEVTIDNELCVSKWQSYILYTIFDME